MVGKAETIISKSQTWKLRPQKSNYELPQVKELASGSVWTQTQVLGFNVSILSMGMND